MISALDRLRALRQGEGLDRLNSPLEPDSLPMNWRIEYEERSAFLEYDGGLSRDQAERQALQEIIERINQMKNVKNKNYLFDEMSNTDIITII